MALSAFARARGRFDNFGYNHGCNETAEAGRAGCAPRFTII
jgi:hypothetical protein